MPHPTNRSQQPPVIVDPTEAPAFLADVAGRYIYDDRKPAWADRARSYYLRRFGICPNLNDLSAERKRRDLAKRKTAPQPVERSTVEPLPMLSNTPSPFRAARMAGGSVPSPSGSTQPVNVVALFGVTFARDGLAFPPGDRRRRHLDAEYDAA